MSRLRVLVLRGGPSDEYSVSMETGRSVLESLNRGDFDPIDVTITKSGEWLSQGRTRYPEHIIPAADVVFIALHGQYGEDGTVQRMLDRFGVPYTGSKAYASGISMHKVLTKEHVRSAPCALAHHTVVSRTPGKTGAMWAGEIHAQFAGKYVIKPLRSGSSVGVSLVKEPHHLGRALDTALLAHDEVMVEALIEGREVTCGVVERFRNHERYVLPPILIVPPPEAAFFSNEVKYNGQTQELCPAPIPYKDKERIERAAKAVHEILDLRQYSRSDFILGNDGELYFLEVNTLPGLTTESLFPKSLSAVGATYDQFIHHLVTDAYTTH